KGGVSMPSGGKRTGAGRPRKPLSVRIEEGIGVVKHSKPKVLDFPDENSKKSKIQKNSNVPTFLEMASKEGGDILPTATEIYEQTVEWVNSTGCEKYVPKQLIEDFAFTRRSYLESEYMNKKLGRVMQNGKPSPYVKVALEYLKHNTALYREIWSIVAQNSTVDFNGGGNSKNTFLEMLTNRGF
ncbi:MAG: hypothetical protein ACRCW1_07590, partial [Anaerotignaceae bacterium]